MSGRHFLEKGIVVQESTRHRRTTEDSTDSGVDKERMRGLGLEGEMSERTTTRVGPRVQSEEDNQEYGMADLTKTMAGAKKKFFFRRQDIGPLFFLI